MQLFNFGGTDYTRLIRVPDYQINRIPLFTTWTDGNNITHRDVSRHQLTGTITVYFDSPDAQEDFLAALNGAMEATGYLTCQLYAVNDDAVYTANVYVDFTPKNELPLLGRKPHGGIQLKVTER